MHAKIIDGEVVLFPYTLDMLHTDNPNISFPKEIPVDLLLEYGIHRVVSTGVEYDINNEVATINGCKYNNEKNRWETSWLVRSKTDEEISAERALLAGTRRNAYQNEADPLFFKWQRGEGTQEAWLAKIEEIKSRYPKE